MSRFRRGEVEETDGAPFICRCILPCFSALPICSGYSTLRNFTPVSVDSSPMNRPIPQVKLISECGGFRRPGWWRFCLLDPQRSEPWEVDDIEPNCDSGRLELLCVVRGLESLERPSRVTLLTPSRYVREGIRYGLEEWKSSDWQWEAYGQMIPLRNEDLWRRIDRAMQFHQIDCQIWHVEGPHRITRPKGESFLGDWPNEGESKSETVESDSLSEPTTGELTTVEPTPDEPVCARTSLLKRVFRNLVFRPFCNGMIQIKRSGICLVRRGRFGWNELSAAWRI